MTLPRALAALGLAAWSLAADEHDHKHEHEQVTEAVAVLVPNLRGAEAAVAAGAHKITIPLSASETHSLKNLRRTHDQVLAEVRSIRAAIDALPASQRPRLEGSLPTAGGSTDVGAAPAH